MLCRFQSKTFNASFVPVSTQQPQAQSPTNSIKWVIMCEPNDQKIGREIRDQLLFVANQQGPPMEYPRVVTVTGRSVRHWEDAAHESAELQPEFVLCIIPDRVEGIYARCKLVFDVVGVTSQMVSTPKAQEMMRKSEKNSKRNGNAMQTYAGNIFAQVMDKMKRRNRWLSLDSLPKVYLRVCCVTLRSALCCMCDLLVFG